MSGWHWSGAAAALITLAASDGFAAEQVGQAVLIKTTVTGDGGALVKSSPVHRDERIKTSRSGLGEFIFRDGTKFAIGANSSVVIDKFVFNGGKSAKNLTINAAKGSFRWISGSSPSSAYRINTPAGTIGIRGTALDIFVGRGGKTAVVLLQGRARFCGSNGCQELRRRCDAVVATPRGGVTSPERVSMDTLAELGTQRALPFISGHQQLSGRFRVRGCALSASLNKSRGPASSTPNRSSTPSTPDTPNTPDTPDTPDTPTTPTTPSIPNIPSRPSTPNTPNTPNTPSTPNNAGPPPSSPTQGGYDGYSNYGNYGNQGRGSYGNYGNRGNRGGRGNGGGEGEGGYPG